MRSSIWHVEASLNLESSEGYRAVLVALEEAGFLVVADPYVLVDPDFDPPEYAL